MDWLIPDGFNGVISINSKGNIIYEKATGYAALPSLGKLF